MSTDRIIATQTYGAPLTRRRLIRRAGTAGLGAATLGTFLANGSLASGGVPAARPHPWRAAPLEHLAELQELRTTGLVQAMRAEPFGARNVEATIVALARAGIEVYEGPAATAPLLPVEGEPSPLRLLYWQVRNLALEVSARSGQLGADLDGLAPAAEGAPSLSQALVAYAGSSPTPGGEIAQKLIDLPDFNHSGETIFPAIVQTLFAAELARVTQPASQAAPQASEPCASMQSFAQLVLVDVLTALANAPEGSFEWIHPEMVEYFRDHLPVGQGEGKEDQLAYAIREAAVVLAIASQIVSLAKPWTLRIEPSPPSTRFGVGDEVIEGEIAARMDFGGLTEWPAELVDCAVEYDLTFLPPFSAAGDDVDWTTTESPLPLLGFTEESEEFDEGGQALLWYVTNHESPEQARGEARTGRLVVKATATRRKMAKLYDHLLRRIHEELFHLPAIDAAFSQWRLPIFEAFEPLLRVTGTGVLAVVYHEEDPEGAQSETTIMVEKRLIGTWEMGDLTGYYNSIDVGLDGDGFSFEFVHQGGGEFFTFMPDGTFEVSTTDFSIGAIGQTPLGSADAVIIFNGRATGVYATDGERLTLTYSGGGDLWAVATVSVEGFVTSRDIPDPAGGLLLGGDLSYTVEGNRLELLTSRAPGVPIVLTKLG